MFDRQVSTRGLAVCTALGTALSMSVGVVAVVPSVALNVAPVAQAQTKVERNSDGYITTNVLESAKLVIDGKEVDPNDTEFWQKRAEGGGKVVIPNGSSLRMMLNIPPGVQPGDKLQFSLVKSPIGQYVGTDGKEVFVGYSQLDFDYGSTLAAKLVGSDATVGKIEMVYSGNPSVFVKFNDGVIEHSNGGRLMVELPLLSGDTVLLKTHTTKTTHDKSLDGLVAPGSWETPHEVQFGVVQDYTGGVNRSHIGRYTV